MYIKNMPIKLIKNKRMETNKDIINKGYIWRLTDKCVQYAHKMMLYGIDSWL